MVTYVRQVWDSDLRRELAVLEQALPKYPVLSVDCDGFLLKTPRTPTGDLWYSDLRLTVDQTHIMQLGVTLSNHGGTVFSTWKFNFELDVDEDVHTKDTVAFLKGQGIDFQKHRADGIKRTRFGAQFCNLMASKTTPLTWVTFHGLYDFAHILKVLTNNAPMPDTSSGFRDLLGYSFEEIVDLKVMAKFCDGISDMEEVGLQKLADLLSIKREDGEALHEAGSDSLLTAMVFSNMRRRFQDDQHHVYTDYLFGITERIGRSPAIQVRYSHRWLCQPLLPLRVPCYRRYRPYPRPPRRCLLLPLHTSTGMGQY